MWKSQIALRHVLGDPWPSMSLEARGLNDVDDRVTLVAAMNEISRLGRDNLTRTNEAHREVTEQGDMKRFLDAVAFDGWLQS